MNLITSNGHNGVHHPVDEQIDHLYAWFPGAVPTSQPLPEAALSITLKGKLGGQEAMITARGQSPAEFRRNLEAIKGLLDPVTPTTQASGNSQGRGKDWCPVHQYAMQRHENAKGVWFSHYIDGKHCKGR